MPPAADLESLARARFTNPPLMAAEIRLCRAAVAGQRAVCGPNPTVHDIGNDPSAGELWGAEREIRADLIRWICVNRDVARLVDPQGIDVFGARISGMLNLFHVTVPFPLSLGHCRIDGEMNLRSADILGINLQGSWVDSIAADGVQVKNNVFLRRGFHACGQVRLLAARIGGNLECDGGTFENPSRPGHPESGVALAADGAVIGGAVFLRDGFSALGEVRLLAAEVRGFVDCTNAVIRNPSAGQIALERTAMHAESLRVRGSVFLRSRFRAEGEVKLSGAQIDGDLDVTNATLSNNRLPENPSGGTALSADRIVVGGSIFLGGSFRADGEVRMLGARIGSDLDCSGGKFNGPEIIANGAIRRALSLHAATVRGNVFLREGFAARGEVSFTGARIDGNLEFTSATIDGDMVLQSACVRSALMWSGIANTERLRVDLSNGSVGALNDELKSWPKYGDLLLDGLTYERFAGSAPKDAKSRLNWLARQGSVVPQPYRQLAKVLRDEGNDAGARQVLFEMEDRRRKNQSARRWQRAWNWILRWTIRYGYSPGLALAWLAALIVVSAVLFQFGYRTGNIVPSDAGAYSMFIECRRLPPQYERFNAFIYSIENAFPLVKLGQSDRWQPDPSPGRFVLLVRNSPRAFSFYISLAGLLRWARWIEILMGWVLATFFVAGVTGVVRRE